MSSFPSITSLSKRRPHLDSNRITEIIEKIGIGSTMVVSIGYRRSRRRLSFKCISSKICFLFSSRPVRFSHSNLSSNFCPSRNSVPSASFSAGATSANSTAKLKRNDEVVVVVVVVVVPRLGWRLENKLTRKVSNYLSFMWKFFLSKKSHLKSFLKLFSELIYHL